MATAWPLLPITYRFFGAILEIFLSTNAAAIKMSVSRFDIISKIALLTCSLILTDRQTIPSTANVMALATLTFAQISCTDSNQIAKTIFSTIKLGSAPVSRIAAIILNSSSSINVHATTLWQRLFSPVYSFRFRAFNQYWARMFSDCLKHVWIVSLELTAFVASSVTKRSASAMILRLHWFDGSVKFFEAVLSLLKTVLQFHHIEELSAQLCFYQV